MCDAESEPGTSGSRNKMNAKKLAKLNLILKNNLKKDVRSSDILNKLTDGSSLRGKKIKLLKIKTTKIAKKQTRGRGW